MSGGRHWKSPRTESYVRHAVLKHAPLTLAQRAGHHFNGSRLPGTQEAVAILNFRVVSASLKLINAARGASLLFLEGFCSLTLHLYAEFVR